MCASHHRAIVPRAHALCRAPIPLTVYRFFAFARFRFRAFSCPSAFGFASHRHSVCALRARRVPCDACVMRSVFFPRRCVRVPHAWPKPLPPLVSGGSCQCNGTPMPAVACARATTAAAAIRFVPPSAPPPVAPFARVPFPQLAARQPDTTRRTIPTRPPSHAIVCPVSDSPARAVTT